MNSVQLSRMLRFVWMPVLGLIAGIQGCSRPANPEASPTPASVNATPAPSPTNHARAFHQDRPLTGLPRVKLQLGARELQAELAISVTEIATGQMHRAGIGPDDAMLFVFGSGDSRSFYMRNVDFDIAAAYIDSEGFIQEIVQLKKRDESPVPSKSNNIQFVLETAPDWFTRNGVGVGTLIRLEAGGLRETVGRRAMLR